MKDMLGFGKNKVFKVGLDGARLEFIDKHELPNFPADRKQNILTDQYYTITHYDQSLN